MAFRLPSWLLLFTVQSALPVEEQLPWMVFWVCRVADFLQLHACSKEGLQHPPPGPPARHGLRPLLAEEVPL